VRDQDGEIIGTLIPERTSRRSGRQRALHQSRERFKRILEDMPLASSYTDDVGNIEFVNRVFTDIFGYPLEDVPTIEEWFMHAYPDPAYREEVMARWNADATRARQEGTRIGPAEYHITCKDGRERICEITGTFMESGMMAVFTDITERILSAEALRQSEERFRVQFRGIPIPTYIWKGQGDDFSLIDYNDAALEFTREGSRGSGVSQRACSTRGGHGSSSTCPVSAGADSGQGGVLGHPADHRGEEVHGRELCLRAAGLRHGAHGGHHGQKGGRGAPAVPEHP
jgi:PAS domain S-box-containing protein